MPLDISIAASPPAIAHFSLAGSLDTTTAPELQEHFDRFVTPQVDALVIDLEALSFISSEGLRVLIKARKMMRNRNGAAYFVNPSRQVAKVFEIVTAAPVNEIFSSMAELDEYLTAIQKKISEDHGKPSQSP
jgi:anti-sigma B factor antagonist